jgi:hypothetical protein
MKQLNVAYIGLDLHATSSEFGVIDGQGQEQQRKTLPTNPQLMNDWLGGLAANHKFLTVEEGPLTQWISWQLREQVDELLVCDPKENFWISRSAKKTDSIDAVKLARLLRMGELRSVWHPAEKNDRALFAAAAAHYITMRREQVRLKHQIKSRFRRWGVIDVTGESVYSKQGRAGYLEQLTDKCIHVQIEKLFTLLDHTVQAQEDAKLALQRLGSCYEEITEFQKMPGIGPILAHLFSALVQTPHRFKSAGQLWRWSRLGITDRSSSGKPLGYQRLDPNGRTEMKDISYRAWKAGARQATESNEVKRFYEKSLVESNTPTNARLNTQRKILKVLWTIWRKQVRYNPDLF